MMTKAALLEKAGKEKRTLLTEIEAKEWLKSVKIPVVETKLATSKTEAMEIAKKLGFPVVMKIVSPDVVHKSDAGGVKLKIENATQAGKAYSEILASIKKHYPKAKITGISVQKMAKQGVEIIIGMTKDAQFGPVIMFGLGGILVEVLKDVSFRIVPLEKRDAAEMITEIKGFPILKGYRGQEPANIPYLEDLNVKVSDFVDKNPEIKELDLNPVFAYKDGALAVDARIILESK
jgi:acetate---CoA ligase (ADP-forming) subunit beta